MHNIQEDKTREELYISLNSEERLLIFISGKIYQQKAEIKRLSCLLLIFELGHSFERLSQSSVQHVPCLHEYVLPAQ